VGEVRMSEYWAGPHEPHFGKPDADGGNLAESDIKSQEFLRNLIDIKN